MLLDFDSVTPSDLLERVRFVCALHRLTVEWLRVDRTRHGWHVIVQVRQRVALLRLAAIQAVLGSDWKREAFNTARAVRSRHLGPMWRHRLNILFTRHTRGVSL